MRCHHVPAALHHVMFAPWSAVIQTMLKLWMWSSCLLAALNRQTMVVALTLVRTTGSAPPLVGVSLLQKNIYARASAPPHKMRSNLSHRMVNLQGCMAGTQAKMCMVIGVGVARTDQRQAGI